MNKSNKFINASLSKKIAYIKNIYYKIIAQTFYRMFFKSIGPNSFIKKPLFLTPEFITIGSNVRIWSDARIEGISSYAHTQFNPHVILEDGVSFQQRCHITAADTLIIGKNTVALFDVMITNIDHEYECIDLPIGSQPLIVKETKIGENCFIGSGAKIQAGTILGRHCVVGTNAVVRGCFPDYCVIVGVPAKIVKRYDDETLKWRKTNKNGRFINEV